MEFSKKPLRPYFVLLVLLLLVNALVFWGAGQHSQSLPQQPVSAQAETLAGQ